MEPTPVFTKATRFAVWGGQTCQFNVRRLTYFCHLLALAAFVSTAYSGAKQRSTTQGFHSAVRFCLVLAFLDPKITIPFQVLYSLVEVLLHVCVMEEGDFWVQLGSFSSGQVHILVATIASSMFIDMGLRGLIYARLDTADAESLLSSFRRVLRGGLTLEGNKHQSKWMQMDHVAGIRGTVTLFLLAKKSLHETESIKIQC